MSVYYQDDLVTLYHGDCLDVLASMPDNSIDSIVTDPPYGLSNTTPEQVAETITRWVSGDREYLPTGRGFMGKEWDSFVPPVAVWDECLRVLKPGGHVVAFAGSRTHDFMTLSIRLAGFEIRDSLAWLYGSGFPKSMDVSKAIDKTKKISIHKRCGTPVSTDEKDITPLDGDGESSGYSAACLKCDEDLFPFEVEQVSASEVREVVGSGSAGAGFNPVKGFGSGVTTLGDKVSSQTWDVTAPATPEAQCWDGWGTALKPAFEPIVLARKPFPGTVAENVLEHGTGAINVDACRVGMSDADREAAKVPQPTIRPDDKDSGHALGSGEGRNGATFEPAPAGRWPANVLLDEHAATWVDEQSGVSGPTKSRVGYRTPTDSGIYGNWDDVVSVKDYDDKGGGASRFFPVFKYQAKAPKRERPVIERADGTKIQHPTVKPLAIMRWLLRLVTPPGGTTLDPFAGSGTTIEAAILEGFNPVGIEKETDYLPLITTRITRAKTSVQEVLDLGGIA